MLFLAVSFIMNIFISGNENIVNRWGKTQDNLNNNIISVPKILIKRFMDSHSITFVIERILSADVVLVVLLKMSAAYLKGKVVD